MLPFYVALFCKLCCAAFFEVMFCYAKYVVSCLCYVTLHYVMLRYVTLRYNMSHNIMLHKVTMSCHVMLLQLVKSQKYSVISHS